MITVILIILAFIFAWNTVAKWTYRKLWRSSIKVNAELIKELDKAVTANWELQTRLNGKVAGEAYVARLEWPDEIG